MKHKEIKRVCQEDSAYSLLIYFLISSVEEIKSTFYFMSDGVPKEIRDKMPGLSHYFEKRKFMTSNKYAVLFRLFWLRATATLRWPFLRTADLYGKDHAFFSSGLVGDRQLIVIEDGTINYNPPKNTLKKRWITSLLFGPMRYSNRFGDSPNCKELILTGLAETEYTNKLSPTIVSLKKLWDESSLEKKNLILSIYNITKEDIEMLSSRPNILFTQPLYEDNMMSEEEKIEIYRKLIADIGEENVVIKSHPREKTDYNCYFHQAYWFNKKVPFQLLNLLGIKFKKSLTVCSTAALGFDYPIEIIFLGSEINPNIVKGYGVVRLSDYKK
ncbi:MAG: hypothetical protein HUK00_00110 [Bacteroidaceae bacterium]|nr:hypothetical protein [Bacteroidaceae bacterium]